MCGIIGYIGEKNPVDILINGLKSLEYRGYDSAGIALKNNDEVEVIKSIGKIVNLEEKINKGGLTFYWGTDPSADSLHIGHLSSLLTAKRLEMGGHHPILLVGGATGLIGDPRPTSERPMISKDELNHNFLCLKEQAERIFARG